MNWWVWAMIVFLYFFFEARLPIWISYTCHTAWYHVLLMLLMITYGSRDNGVLFFFLEENLFISALYSFVMVLHFGRIILGKRLLV
jgi:hypothetical protein